MAAPRTVICVGDVHGYISKLESLWSNLQSALPADAFATALVIFLGDYNDRGPHTRHVIDFLLALPARHPAQRHVFLCGNHDLAFAAFVGALPPPPDGSPFSSTWAEYIDNEAHEGWFRGPGHEDMHVQGRRWGGVIKERWNPKKGLPYKGSIYDAQSTFESYGVAHGSPGQNNDDLALSKVDEAGHPIDITMDSTPTPTPPSGPLTSSQACAIEAKVLGKRPWRSSGIRPSRAGRGAPRRRRRQEEDTRRRWYYRSHGRGSNCTVDLMKAVPEEHKKFLHDLVWVHEEEDVPIDTDGGQILCKLIAVHAGLEKSLDLNEQLRVLRTRDTRVPKVQMLSGRQDVWNMPQDLVGKQTIVVSGHHGKLHIDGLRFVIDEGGGYEDKPIAAIVFPSKEVIRSTEGTTSQN